MNTETCVRLVVWGGVVRSVEGKHAFRWSGKIPNTGVRYCVFCGTLESEVENKCNEN